MHHRDHPPSGARGLAAWTAYLGALGVVALRVVSGAGLSARRERVCREDREDAAGCCVAPREALAIALLLPPKQSSAASTWSPSHHCTVSPRLDLIQHVLYNYTEHYSPSKIPSESPDTSGLEHFGPWTHFPLTRQNTRKAFRSYSGFSRVAEMSRTPERPAG